AGTIVQYKAVDHGFTLSQPVIFLTNGNSASASELLTAAVKDHQKATIVGTNTYGKGTVQSMFPLSNGGVLKMTVDHFYSPLGHEIDKMGVSPDVVIQQADSIKAAELMLSDYPVALAKGRTTDYWEAWGELQNSDSFSATQTTERYPFYYPGYRKVSELSGISLDKKFAVHFSGVVDWQSVNNTSIEMINSKTGERTLAKFEPLDQSNVQMIPQVALTPNTTYWLVIHPTVCDTSGRALQGGGLVVVHTIQEEETEGTAKIQSVMLNDRESERKPKSVRNPDYGWAIMN
ncbi:S41 family peptidase, partial [Desulfosporosinus sp. OT]|uniref:S41 family peptidase n=1 Tax=Desulfosporosinus sp. OT TaxID=913865 RepID=UPI000223A2D0